MRKLYPLLTLLFFAAANLSAQNFDPEKIALHLWENMEAEPDGWHSVHIMLADRVDLAALDAELSARRAKKSERARAIVSALREKADESQNKLLGILRSSEKVETESVKGYWIANAIFATMQTSAIAELSQRDDVLWVGLNGILELEKYERLGAAPPVSPDGIEPGLAAIDATELWAMGYTGYGQLAMTSDTGVDPAHPALASRNHNFNVPKEQTWFELDENTLLPNGLHDPFDCGDHGTHVTGTMLGLDRLNNDTIGVAFNANWMGSPTLCGIGTEDNVAAFQWALDPDNDPFTTDDMPTIVNNSWRDPSLAGEDCNSVYVPVFQATEAAGIAVIFSAGNEGPGPMTITPPKNIIINEVNPMTTASLNANNSTLPISNFSSRGPSICTADSALLIKPEVAAPGQSVRSCVPGGYDFFSGTSMAAPHVSGAIMLLAEAFPDLSAHELKLAVYHSCIDLGIPGEDNTFGMGIINVKNAFDTLVAQGNVPVSPHRANDILMVDMQLPEFACGSAVAPALVAENAGTDTIFSFEIHYEAGSESGTETWTGTLAPRERVSLLLPSFSLPTGQYDVLVSVEMPNGVEDERPLNNRFRRATTVIDRDGFEAHVEGSDIACEGTGALLRGVSPYEEGSLSINWYDEPLGTDPVSTDEAFLTPPLSVPTTYFAEALYTVPVGENDISIGESFLLDTTELGMRFEVLIPMKLKAVHVFAQETGGRIFDLQTPDGEGVRNSVEFITETGKARVELDWDIEPGEYEIRIEGGKALLSNSDGATYPHSIDDIFTITGTSDGQSANGAWYYFYDWEVEFIEPCGRTPVTVEVGPPGDAPVASFTPSADTVNVADNVAIEFANTTQDATGFHWNFGDSNVSENESPEHTYAFPGEYTVSLVATSTDGCTDAALHTIVVEEEFLSALRPPVLPDEVEKVALFPNPVTDRLTVHLDLPAARRVRLQLTDTAGRLVRSAEFPNTQKGQLELTTADFPSGLYFLLVDLGTEASVFKVVVW